MTFPAPSAAEIKAGWRDALAISGVRVSLRRGSGIGIVQADSVRARFTFAQSNVTVGGAVDVIDNVVAIYADDTGALGEIRTGDKMVFNGRTYTLEKTDSGSGRVFGVPVVYFAIARQ